MGMDQKFKDAISNNKKTLLKLIWKHPSKAWKTILGKGADSLYTTMSHADDPKYKQLDQPLWLNFGYWNKPSTYDEACQALALKLAEHLELDIDDTLLDVGFGFGEQDILWKREFNVKSIHGLNITPLHVEIAQMRVQMSGLNNSIHLQEGDATSMPFNHNSFTKVSALECAFHFNTRKKFLKEAFRVLKPGGRIGLTDCFPRKDRRKDFWYWFVLKSMSIPYVNMISENEYIQLFEDIGFTNVEIHKITDKVFTGMAAYFKKIKEGIPKDEVKVDLYSENVRIEDWWSGRGWYMGLDEYAIVTANKPK